MKAMKSQELRDKKVEDLETMLQKEEMNLFELRRKAGFRELKDTTSVKVQRHNIARIKTILTEKRGNK